MSCLASPILDRTPLRKSPLASITDNAKGLRKRGHPAISREAQAKKLSRRFRHTLLTAHIQRAQPGADTGFPRASGFARMCSSPSRLFERSLNAGGGRPEGATIAV